MLLVAGFWLLFFIFLLPSSLASFSYTCFVFLVSFFVVAERFSCFRKLIYFKIPCLAQHRSPSSGSCHNSQKCPRRFSVAIEEFLITIIYSGVIQWVITYSLKFVSRIFNDFFLFFIFSQIFSIFFRFVCFWIFRDIFTVLRCFDINLFQSYFSRYQKIFTLSEIAVATFLSFFRFLRLSFQFTIIVTFCIYFFVFHQVALQSC